MNYFATGKGEKYGNEYISLSVCLYVSLSTHISKKNTRPSSLNFVCMLTLDVAQYSSSGIVIHYVPGYFQFCGWYVLHTGAYGASYLFLNGEKIA